MRKQRGFGEALVVVMLFVLAFAALIGLGMFFDNWSCKSKWERSGMAAVTWGPVQGCLVKLPDGRWLPEERIREIDVPRKP
jgi:hypothetical protein